MAKSLEELIQLTKNPHYKMTASEAAQLQAYRLRESKVQVVEKNVVVKATPTIQMHPTDLDSLQPLENE